MTYFEASAEVRMGFANKVLEKLDTMEISDNRDMIIKLREAFDMALDELNTNFAY